MLSRFLILLFILVLSSVIWWPGLNDAPSFEHLSDLHLKDTQQKIGSMVESVIPVIDSVQAKVTDIFNALSGGSYLPSTEVDARKDEPAEDFFNRLWSSPYFASMRAMLEMSVVRAILALAWFTFLSPLLIAVVIDAWVVRRLKYESFAVNHPTLYQAALSAPSVLLVCAFAVMLMPWFIPAWIAALFYAAFLVSIHLIVSNFHRFG